MQVLYRKHLVFVGCVEVRNTTVCFGLSPTYKKITNSKIQNSLQRVKHGHNLRIGKSVQIYRPGLAGACAGAAALTQGVIDLCNIFFNVH
jgi:hypothetical protein